MRRFTTMSLTIVCVLYFAPELLAQTVTWAGTYPNSPQAGFIAGQGTATTGMNQSIKDVNLYATSATGTAGGAGGQVKCTVTGLGPYNFIGTVTGLPTGTYQIFARMSYTQMGQTKYWDSPIIGSISVK